MENKTFLVDYINLFDKVYVITSNSKNEFNFLETFIVDGERKYKIPDTDTTITNRSREEIIDVNKNNFMKAYIDYLNESMQKGKSCPFLIDKTCSVYDYRPIICRVHGLAYKVNNNEIPVEKFKLTPNGKLDRQALHKIKISSNFSTIRCCSASGGSANNN